MRPGVVHSVITLVETADSALRRSPSYAPSIRRSQMRVGTAGPLIRVTGAFVVGGHYFGAHSLHFTAEALLVDYFFNHIWTNISHYDSEVAHYCVLEELLIRKALGDSCDDLPKGKSLYALIALVGMPSRIQVGLGDMDLGLQGDEAWLRGNAQTLQHLRHHVTRRVKQLICCMDKGEIAEAKRYHNQIWAPYERLSIAEALEVRMLSRLLLHLAHRRDRAESNSWLIVLVDRVS